MLRVLLLRFSLAVGFVLSGATTGCAQHRIPAIDPTGNYLLASNQESDNIVLFRIDGRTGGLTPTGDVWNVGGPVCTVFSVVK